VRHANGYDTQYGPTTTLATRETEQTPSGPVTSSLFKATAAERAAAGGPIGNGIPGVRAAASPHAAGALAATVAAAVAAQDADAPGAAVADEGRVPSALQVASASGNQQVAGARALAGAAGGMGAHPQHLVRPNAALAAMAAREGRAVARREGEEVRAAKLVEDRREAMVGPHPKSGRPAPEI
jgi:hypothetical protein